jgi:murein hydrolase activator
MVKLLFSLFIICVGFLYPQDQEISEKRDELSSLRDEIKQLEKEIQAKTKAEKRTFETLEKMKQQAFKINKMVNTLKIEEQQKGIEINRTTNEIRKLEENISLLKKNYARSIKGLYKYGQPSYIELFMNSESVNQALVRKKYLERFSEQRRSEVDILERNIARLSVLKTRLEEEKNEKTLLAREKAEEETRLKSKMNNNKKLIAEIKKNKSELKKEVDARKKAEIKIKALVEKLVADAERKKKEELDRLADLNKKKETGTKVTGADTESPEFNLSTAGLASFRGMKGKLNWPVPGRIVGKFGENKNQVLKTVTLNYGVDILTTKNPDVKCVADGIVSAIDWIPGYGSVVIISHSEEFRTVYSRLSEIYVNEGERIKGGAVIAKVSESLEGNILHFEIWNSRNNQNPEIWLARK